MRFLICLILLGIVTAQKHPGDDKEPKKPKRRLTPKGTGSRADWAFCTKDKPCGQREGDCDGDDQCQAGLECGVDNCRAFHQEAHRLADCCVLKKGPASKCVVDTPLRHLTHYVDLGEDVTPESCIEACTTLAKPGPGPKIPGYVFAGVQAGSQCFCGNANISSTWEAPASECNMPCSGNSKQICGGSMRMNVFETGIPWLTGTRTLSATCDNIMRIYFDGKLVFEDEDHEINPYQWKITTTLDIPFGTKVVGISCQDFGLEKGIIASTSNGLVTDNSWLCTSDNVRDWIKQGSTAQFQNSVTLGENGDEPWGVRPNIGGSAKWIWAPGDSNWAGCKINLKRSI